MARPALKFANVPVYCFADLQGEDAMNITRLYEIASTDRRLNKLGLAIAEAKKNRALLQKKQTGRTIADLEKLDALEKQIDRMETTLFEIETESGDNESV